MTLQGLGFTLAGAIAQGIGRIGPTLAVRPPPASSAAQSLRPGPRAGRWCECPPDAL
jgi:hypothetical protein